MKIYNLKRGSGKTTRLLYISEYTDAPILCIDQSHKKIIENQAQTLGIKIPEPITIGELSNSRVEHGEPDYIVDEALTYLQAAISRLSGGRLSNPLAISFSENE